MTIMESLMRRCRLGYPDVIGVRFGAIIFCLWVAGCSSIGPDTVTRDRIDYNNALATSWKEQLLQNIVRLRYGDVPQFMDVSSVVAGYTIQGQISAGATQVLSRYGDFAGARSTGVLGASATYIDRPTISYSPLAGRKFTQSLLEPIQPSAIFSLIAAGYPVQLVIPMTVRALNGIYGRTHQVGVTRPSDPKFIQLVEAFRRVQQSRAISTQVEKHDKEQNVIARFDWQERPEVRKDVEFILKTLKLTTKNGEIHLVYSGVQRRREELAILSRSMLEILATIASDIQVPAQDVKAGTTFANVDDTPDRSDDPSRVNIQSGATPPGDAYAAVRYNDSWFWIANQDLRSKRAFSFLSLFFALAETGVVPAAPTLTIPVQ